MKDIARNLFAKHGVVTMVDRQIKAGYDVMVFWEDDISGIGKVLKYFPAHSTSAVGYIYDLMTKAEDGHNYSSIGMVLLEDLK